MKRAELPATAAGAGTWTTRRCCWSVACAVLLCGSLDARADSDGSAAGPTLATQPLVAATAFGKIEILADDRNGRPIPSFYVSVFRPDGPGDFPFVRLIMDLAGRGTFEAREGQADIVVAAVGFHGSERRHITVSASSTARLHVTLDVSNALRVSVTDAHTGQPIAGAQVDTGGLLLFTLATGESFTNAKGALEIHSLPSRRFHIRVSAKGYRPLIIGGLRGDSRLDQRLDARLTETIEFPARTDVVGIGVALEDTRDGSGGGLVKNVFPETSSASVLSAGDRILSVDGRFTKDMPFDAVVDALLGVEGTAAHLKVRRGRGTMIVALERKRFAVSQAASDEDF